MSLRLRLLLALLVVFCGGGYFLTRKALEQVRPRYVESMEETLVDTSVLLASVLETQLGSDPLDAGALERALGAARRRRFDAQIYSLHKTAVDMRVYVTDAKGMVIYDSTGEAVGKDYSRWNDVARTLAGKYGARSSRIIPGNDDTQTIYVAAPIFQNGRVAGVLSVGKPATEINQLVAVAQRRILYGALVGGLALLALLLLMANWVIAPIERLTKYARDIRDDRPAALPALPGRTLQDLGTAFEEMRDALAGRKHAERYTQALAHEVKAPLAAIRGAAELLGEDMDLEQRRRFLNNIRGEIDRIQAIVERLLELSSLEARKSLARTESMAMVALANDVRDATQSAAAARSVRVRLEVPAGLEISGERFLLRQALINLVQNAIDFSPAGGEIVLRADRRENRIEWAVEDSGPGVPAYALTRVFERFYSLPRPDTGRKSTGIGLALVREIAHLHGGDAFLENRATGGTRAGFWLPRRGTM
ncbi:MAG TPA: two-component system sensor histidine kinase CreC [Candidatus Didemnitutus sp.]|nr:two-component system sensor histidine kinase CreC [Candidatus Didemnitutus sp.]